MLAILDPELRRIAPSRRQSAALVGGLAAFTVVIGAAAPTPCASTSQPRRNAPVSTRSTTPAELVPVTSGRKTDTVRPVLRLANPQIVRKREQNGDDVVRHESPVARGEQMHGAAAHAPRARRERSRLGYHGECGVITSRCVSDNAESVRFGR